MFKIETRNFSHKLPFYPLPFRNEQGGIMFPPNIVGGRYMRDDAVDALNFFERFRVELRDLSIHKGEPEIIVSEAMFFIPADETSRPLEFIRALFNWRAEIVAKNKLDVRGQVIKLAINSPSMASSLSASDNSASRHLMVAYGMLRRSRPERGASSWKLR